MLNFYTKILIMKINFSRQTQVSNKTYNEYYKHTKQQILLRNTCNARP